MRSSGRFPTNLAKSFFTTESLVVSRENLSPLGVRSRASIDPETSTVIAIAMASTLRLSLASGERGRAAATTRSARPASIANGVTAATFARQPAAP